MSLGALLLVGAGMHTTQTAGLALATDLASEKTRHQVVTMLYLMLLVGMVIGASDSRCCSSPSAISGSFRLFRGQHWLSLV